VGSIYIPLQNILHLLLKPLLNLNIVDAPFYSTILFTVRLPHTILVCLTGAALASSGAAYQGLFRNPLADPYLIGCGFGSWIGSCCSTGNFLALHGVRLVKYTGGCFCWSYYHSLVGL